MAWALRTVGVLVAATVQVLVLAISDPALANVTIAATASGGTAASGAMGGGELTLRYAMSPRWALAASARSGAMRAADGQGMLPTREQDLWFVALGVGPVCSVQTWAGTTRLGLLLTHVHHAPPEAWQTQFGRTLAADSSGPVQHRGGGEVALGHAVDTAWTLFGRRLALDGEAFLGALPTSRELSVHGGMRVGVAVGF
jgi:hypothetical protein